MLKNQIPVIITKLLQGFFMFFSLLSEIFVDVKSTFAALDKRWKIRCFYITGIFACTIFLYNPCIFHLWNQASNLFFGQHVLKYLFEKRTIYITIFMKTVWNQLEIIHIHSFQSFSRLIPILLGQAMRAVFVTDKVFFQQFS